MKPSDVDKWVGPLLFGCAGPVVAGFVAAGIAFVMGFKTPLCWGTIFAIVAIGSAAFVLFGKLILE
jgi:hypothetical protein